MPEPRIHNLLESAIFPLRLRPTARDTLQEFIDIDVTNDDLVRILNNNHAYRDIFERFVQKKIRRTSTDEKKDGDKDSTPTHRLIGLLGMIGSRNFILTLRMLRSVTGKFPIQEDGSVDVKTSEYLKCCMDMEELFQRNNYNYSETAYAAGYFYDWIIFLARQRDDFKKLEEYLKQNWKVAVRAALAAHHLSERVGGFTFLKYASAGAICCYSGKALMAFMFPGDEETPNWVEFVTKNQAIESGFPKAFQVLEQDTFGLTHEECASAAIYAFDVFKGFSSAIRYYREPYYLEHGDKNLHHFALLLNIACDMARVWRMPNDEKDPLITEWMKSAAPLKLKPKQLLEAIRAAMGSK